jgi:hypothetical protein
MSDKGKNMTNYTWKITSISTLPSPPAPINEYVVNVGYTVTATDGTHTVSTQGNSQFEIPTTNLDGTPTTYTPFSQLTEAIVLGWVQSQQNVVINTQANLDGQIDSIINPPVTPSITPLPWGNV